MTASHQHVNVLLLDRKVFVQDTCQDVVAPVLAPVAHRFRRQSGSGIEACRYRRQLFQVHTGEDCCWLALSSGLLPRVMQRLQAARMPVTLHDLREWQHSGFCVSSLCDFRSLMPSQRRFLSHAEKNLRGIALTAGTEEAYALIRQLIRSVPTGQVLVVACNRERVRKIKRFLRRDADRPIIETGHEFDTKQPSIMVKTAVIGDLWWWRRPWSMVILADVQTARATPNRLNDELFPTTPAYCVFPGSGYPPESCDLDMEAHYGPVFRLHDSAVPQPRAVFVPLRSEPSEDEDRTLIGLPRKRAAIWHNSSFRNEQVTRITKAVASQFDESRVCIIVECPEHARQLANLLPGWRIRGFDTVTSCIPAIQHREIATFCAADRWGFWTDIVVRADGGSEWPLAHRLPGKYVAPDRGHLLVDFSDDMDRQAIRDTASRRESYLDAGYVVGDVDFGAELVEQLDGIWQAAPAPSSIDLVVLTT